MLVEVSVPLEVIGTVKCDFDGYYHVEVLGQEVDTDKDTYWRVIRARDRARELHRARELGIEALE